MNLNPLLIQLVLCTAVFLLLQAPRTPRGWVVVALLLVAVVGVSFLWVPEGAGFISGGVWFVLVALPLLGSWQLTHLVAQERYGLAQAIAQILRWFHPADGFWEYPDLLKGLALGQQGELDQAAALLAPYQTPQTALGRTAIVLLYGMGARWQELYQWSETHLPERLRFKDWLILTAYVRSLGELGKLNQLLATVAQLEQQLSHQRATPLLAHIRLYAFAFSGYTWQVRQVLEGPLAYTPDETRQFWLATADMAAGHQARAHHQLLELRDRTSGPLRHGIQWRLDHPLPPAQASLTPATRQVLAHSDQALRQTLRAPQGLLSGVTTHLFTSVLIAANLAMFGLATAIGGSENEVVLATLGGLVPAFVFAGEWWRIITANFLHYGILHLLANMLGLYIFGGLVEGALGHRKFLLCYAFSGLGSMLIVALVAVQCHRWGPLVGELLSLGSAFPWATHCAVAAEQITVGASGAIMGLLGAEGAIQLRGWRQTKAKTARDRLRIIGIVVVLQIISDLLTPQISVVGHLAGLSLGFLAGLWLSQTRWQ